MTIRLDVSKRVRGEAPAPLSPRARSEGSGGEGGTAPREALLLRAETTEGATVSLRDALNPAAPDASLLVRHDNRIVFSLTEHYECGEHRRRGFIPSTLNSYELGCELAGYGEGDAFDELRQRW